MEMDWVEGRFVPRYGNQSFYIIMSQSSLLSKNQRIFGQDINVVGRVCRIHNSVNASSIPSDDPLSEIFEFSFNGNLTFSETCHSQGAPSTENRTIFSYAKIKLPLTCNIHSDRINCESIKFNSNKPEEMHVLRHRMEVIEEHFEEKKININSTTFIKSDLEAELPPTVATPFMEKIKLPLIISLAAVAGFIFMCLIRVCLMKSHRPAQPGTGNTITINAGSNAHNESPVSTMVTPSCPEAPAHIEEAPPSYHDSVDIEELRTIPHAKRSAAVTRRLSEHYESTRNSKNQHRQ